MRLIRDLPANEVQQQGCVATIGTFDGVHRGHQAVLRQLIELGKDHRLPTAVITFEPHPQEYFRPAMAPARLTLWREKFLQLERQGIDNLVCLRFNQALASLTAAEFVDRLLVRGLGCWQLVIGDDFRFGRGREGDYPLLQRLAPRYGFALHQAATFSLHGARVSSTRIRECLSQGALTEANQLLGWRYGFSGRIVPGERRGRQLGFPTANLNLHRHRVALSGIFVAAVHGLSAHALPAITYIGTKPVFQGKETVLETHIFDFDRDCYGSYMRVELLAKLREDRSFDSVAALQQQIAADIVQAKHWLGLPGPHEDPL